MLSSTIERWRNHLNESCDLSWDTSFLEEADNYELIQKRLTEL